MRRCSAIRKLCHALIVAVIVLQCGASLALAVNETWHEEAHHHDGDEDHDCPVVQLAHGFWDAPGMPVFAVARPSLPPGELEYPDTARAVAALFLVSGVQEHGPPVAG